MGGGSTVGRGGRREHSRERWEEGAECNLILSNEY